jgi:hypothetical protein
VSTVASGNCWNWSANLRIVRESQSFARIGIKRPLFRNASTRTEKRLSRFLKLAADSWRIPVPKSAHQTNDLRNLRGSGRQPCAVTKRPYSIRSPAECPIRVAFFSNRTGQVRQPIKPARLHLSIFAPPMFKPDVDFCRRDAPRQKSVLFAPADLAKLFCKALIAYCILNRREAIPCYCMSSYWTGF